MKKKLLIGIIFLSVLILSVAIPTFSKLRNNSVATLEWDGSFGLSFKRGTGTSDDPYIISNGSELAFFASSLATNDYENKYIKLSDDIIINKGIFIKGDKFTYIYDDETYYLNIEDGKYYFDDAFNNLAGTINDMPSFERFKGTFDGDFHTIYGFYKTGIDDLSIFKNLEGELKNLYIDNAFIYGGYFTSGVVLNADNASIKNIVFNGNVIGNEIVKKETKTDTLANFSLIDTYSAILPIYSYEGLTLKGTCYNASEVIINGEAIPCGEFELSLSSNVINFSGNADFKDMTYSYSLDKNKSAGIVGKATSTLIDGVVNKGFISNIYASGIAGIVDESNLFNSYNNGEVKALYASGIADIVISDGNIKNVYNNGELTSLNASGLINNVYGSDLTIENSFNVSYTYAINDIQSSTVSVINSYNMTTPAINGYLEDDFELFSSFDALSEYYPMYVDKETLEQGNIWVGDELPLLYFDDMKNRTVQIKIGNDTWDKYSIDVDDKYYDQGIHVILTTKDMYRPIKEVYYHISNTVLNKNDLESVAWTYYDSAFEIENEGTYIIYVKYVDYSDIAYYINSDKLILDLNGSVVNIGSGDNIWNDYHTPATKYVNSNLTYQITAADDISGIDSIEYIISDDVKTITELNMTNDWNIYISPFEVANSKYIIYVKVIDNSGYITYVNTDNILKVSYEVSNLKSGDNLSFESYMTYNSSLNFDISLNHDFILLPNLSRYIYTTLELPINTHIVLKDKSSKMVYEYFVDETTYDNDLNGYLYPLSKFKEIGKMTFNKYFTNDDYDSTYQEGFNVLIDFGKISKLDRNISLSFIAKAGTEILESNLKDIVDINLLDTNSNLEINSDYNGVISYNSVNNYVVPLSIRLINGNFNGDEVIDTTLENMSTGISIELVDSLGKKVSRDIYKNVIFEYNGIKYVPDTFSVTNINLGSNYNQDIDLNIITSITNDNLEDNTYYFKLTSYASIDGVNKKLESTNFVLVPLEIKSNISSYTFDASIIGSSIIMKENSRIINFDISHSGVENASVRVSLYKKKELTAYNQEYVLVNLADYVEESLEAVSDNVYLLNNNTLTLKNSVENNGYKFLFELYDGENKVSDIEKLIIIR